MSVILLTKKLLSFNTINPPGNESAIARYAGEILRGEGFRVSYHEFGQERLHMVAEKGVSGNKSPIVLSGHFDTVPLGAKTWETDPFGGEVKEGRIWGRGSSDMKGALASMMIAAIEALKQDVPGGVRLIFSAW